MDLTPYPRLLEEGFDVKPRLVTEAFREGGKLDPGDLLVTDEATDSCDLDLSLRANSLWLSTTSSCSISPPLMLSSS